MIAELIVIVLVLHLKSTFEKLPGSAPLGRCRFSIVVTVPENPSGTAVGTGESSKIRGGVRTLTLSKVGGGLEHDLC